jgi:predicted glycogen debranching enzyme
MMADQRGWHLELPLTDPGFFKAKAYLLDSRGWQHWPQGADTGIAIHPDWTRTAGTIYCAFVRLFGKTKTAGLTQDPAQEKRLKQLEADGYAVIPPSGKLRDLIRELPHIVDTLGCRILHLLPVNPTPTTFARFGRYGSPYACLDLTAIDPALVEFDKRTTGVEQFRELAIATHERGARVFLDIVINHTGWGSTLQENHPQWFLRKPGGEFHSPGAWGTTWEDLVELKQESVALWDAIAESLLVWCRRGVDGFRCDAGYMVPVEAWQYIVARVRQEYGETVFLLEGLGGAWEATEGLLTEGGMAWAYSELFQNYSGVQVSGYLDHALKQSTRAGTLIHYSETHDNPRLAAHGQTAANAQSGQNGPDGKNDQDSQNGKKWSLLRNRLCALASVNGGFGFTCGVEWLATEKIDVHGCTGLNWGAKENIVPDLARLNRLICDHPCFFDGAKLTRLSPPDSEVYALLRESAEGKDTVLVLVNLDVKQPRPITLPQSSPKLHDLLGQAGPEMKRSQDQTTFLVPPATAYCLAASPQAQGLAGNAYRAARARAAWAFQALSRVRPAEKIDSTDWRELANQVDRSPRDFLTAASQSGEAATPPTPPGYPNVVPWNHTDARRITLIPPQHWLLIEEEAPFRATLSLRCDPPEAHMTEHVSSILAAGKHIACFVPRTDACNGTLTVDRCASSDDQISAEVRFLPGAGMQTKAPALRNTDMALLTNGRGAMARVCVDPGRIQSKYDCILGANLNPTLPVDRHVFGKRLRAWINADGFITALNFENLASFRAGPPAAWRFIAQAGAGRTVELSLTADMLPGHNTTVFRFHRPKPSDDQSTALPPDADVRLTVRVDMEDRNFHSETKRNSGAEHHFTSHLHPLKHHGSHTDSGFSFTPAKDRHFRVYATAGAYHPSPEWSMNIPHPIEASRGQEGSGDAFSPGWFELPMAEGTSVDLVVTAEASNPSEAVLGEFDERARAANAGSAEDRFATRLSNAARAYVVRRDGGKTVIAGYPWFLDWGRDTLICARGLLAAGLAGEVQEILHTFARFEENGTLPNIIHGDHVGNRDTSDAPLWFGVACEELAALKPPDSTGRAGFYDTAGDGQGRSIADILRSIASHHLNGTPNGIRVDAESGLVFSPSHFTWMDTNYPAGTPREGYPIEIQCLWIRLLRQLERIGATPAKEPWGAIADRAEASLGKYFWLEEQGWFADNLRAAPGVPAAKAIADDALRSNCLFTVSLGLVRSDRAQRTVEAARRWLVVPGGLRSLAPLPVKLPLEIRHQGGLLNDPPRPYWGRYEGDEDTRRKPAYHNGTAWTWTFPVFCEALAAAWEFSPDAVAAAQAYLRSTERLLDEGCLGQIPEILDGDAPHTQRGCDAQAWGVTEALRVWTKLASGKDDAGVHRRGAETQRCEPHGHF